MFFFNVQQILGQIHCLKVVRIHFGLLVEILKTMIKQNDHCLNIKREEDAPSVGKYGKNNV